MSTNQPHPKPGRAALPLPLTVVGGFLGSGKSSLLNHVLTAPHGRRIAVLVNDFGEVNIDAKLIASVHGETIALANGCVCCTIRDDLLAAVVNLLRSDPLPEHILVETSGVSKPLTVAESFLNGAAAGFVELQNLIVVLDAVLALDVQDVYNRLAIEQIEQADLVVINKTDLVRPQEREALKRRIGAISERARIWETSFGALPLDLIFGETCGSAAAAAAAAAAATEGVLSARASVDNHGAQFGSWIYRSARAWSFIELQRAVDKLPADIYRAKGIVRLDLETGDYGVLQLTGRRSWLRLCDAKPAHEEHVTTELVFIGKPGRVTNATVAAAFEQAIEEQAADCRDGKGYIVNDLRGFEVVFA